VLLAVINWIRSDSTATAPNNSGIVMQRQSGNNFIITAPTLSPAPAPTQTLIDAQCESKMLITTSLAPGETIKTLELWPMPIANGGGGLTERFITKGSEFIWPKPEERFARMVARAAVMAALAAVMMALLAPT
jgi:hypothetical protein